MPVTANNHRKLPWFWQACETLLTWRLPRVICACPQIGMVALTTCWRLVCCYIFKCEILAPWVQSGGALSHVYQKMLYKLCSPIFSDWFKSSWQPITRENRGSPGFSSWAGGEGVSQVRKGERQRKTERWDGPGAHVWEKHTLRTDWWTAWVRQPGSTARKSNIDE